MARSTSADPEGAPARSTDSSVAASGSRMLWAYFRRSWRTYASGVALNAASCLLLVTIPRLLGQVADLLQRETFSASDATWFAGAVAAVGAVRVVAGWTGRVMVHHQGRRFAYELRRDLLRKWATLSPDYYHRHSVGDLLSHALSDVEVIREMATMGVNVSVTGLSVLASVVYMMAAHGDPRLMAAVIGPLAIIPVAVHRLGPRIRARSLCAQEALGRMSQTVEEAIGGVRAVKAFGTERVMSTRFGRRVEAIVAERLALARLSSLFVSLVPFMASVGFVVVLGWGGALVARGAIGLGSFVAFTLYVAMLRHPLEQLGQVLNLWQRGAASLDRVAALLRVAPDVRDAERLVHRTIRGALRVERLTFRYPGAARPALREISFEVEPGETLGIVGATGSGKTTLVNLLLRLYDPPPGTVFLDGEDLLRFPLASLRRAIAHVPQDGFLFSASVLENIGFSEERTDRERAARCARITAVHEDIEGFPEGFDTEIGDRGVRLSGGQRQRVAIARSAYKDAPIRIFDDSLSAVDTITERRILNGLRDRSPGASEHGSRTGIIISHRLSAVQHADEIVVLDEGRIVERGDHAALLRAGGAYARLWGRQAGLGERPPLADPSPAAARETGAVEPALVAGLAALDPPLARPVTEEGA